MLTIRCLVPVIIARLGQLYMMCRIKTHAASLSTPASAVLAFSGLVGFHLSLSHLH